MADTYARYFQAVSTPDPAAAVEVVDEALTGGVPPAALITDVLARAQRVAGEKWMQGEWTIADEHAVTAVTKQALTVVAPPRPRTRGGPHVVVACAEGEWHSLPARMAGELLRDDDLDVAILGASIPVEQLREHLRSSLPDVLALSATMPTSLIGAARSIAAARHEDVPVVVGGNAWGSGQRRARALGAHLRLDDIREVRGRLDEIRAMQPPPLPDLPDEVSWLDDVPREVLNAAFERQCAQDAALGGMDDQQRSEHERDLRSIARHAAAAVACADPSVVSDLLDWLLSMRSARGLPTEAVLDGARHLADAIDSQAPLAAAILRGGAPRERSHESTDRDPGPGLTPAG
ncbi:cobalamin B12-binding domain-containing protein [Nocardioides daeguensis]|uniref:Cobalamin-dependent protein n=1 Tax=Nocardioides daeguensis TaxID=908359 RepID=A0ABP6VHC4_9ACTN|nr:cobalamin-dependent protein [Nocardioides daeguensis]MBV6728994.1 cobalamin-dependent protein [Nocardioides daeguensis]MCR1773515.1 cobalamin-dependent protein [Nocardioides daeguensis]